MCLDVTDLHHALGNTQGEAESYRMHDSFSQMLLKDHFQSTQLSEHRLIQVRPTCLTALVLVISVRILCFRQAAYSGCLQLLELLEILEISWNLKTLLEILEISWNLLDLLEIFV